MEKEIVISTIENFFKEHNSQFSIFLNQREMAVLTLRQQGKTLQDIGDQLKVTRERVRQIEGTALKRQLRSKESAQKLYNSIKGYFFTEEEVETAFSLWYDKLDKSNYLEGKMKLQDFIKILWEQKNVNKN